MSDAGDGQNFTPRRDCHFRQGCADASDCVQLGACYMSDVEPGPVLCPRCVSDYQDPDSWYGFCAPCSAARQEQLKSERQRRWAPKGWRQKLTATG